MSVPASSNDYLHFEAHVDGARALQAGSLAIAKILYGLAGRRGLTDG